MGNKKVKKDSKWATKKNGVGERAGADEKFNNRCDDAGRNFMLREILKEAGGLRQQMRSICVGRTRWRGNF